jgi:hypothetical protein
MQTNGSGGNPLPVRIRLHFQLVAKTLRMLGFAIARRDDSSLLSC